MKFTCPECAAQYDVPDRAIKPAGQTVRCAKCGHRWHFAPLAESAAAAAAVFGLTEKSADFAALLEATDKTADFNVQRDAQLATPAAAVPTLVIPADAAAQRTRKYQAVPKLAQPPRSLVPKYERYVKAAAIVLLLGVIGFLVFGRGLVARKLPLMLPVYHAVGLSPFPVGSGLTFTNVEDTSDFAEGTNQLVIKGEIDNTTPYKIDIPLINLTIIAPTGQSKNFQTRPPAATVEGGQSVPFTLLRRALQGRAGRLC